MSQLKNCAMLGLVLARNNFKRFDRLFQINRMLTIGSGMSIKSPHQIQNSVDKSLIASLNAINYGQLRFKSKKSKVDSESKKTSNKNEEKTDDLEEDFDEEEQDQDDEKKDDDLSSIDTSEFKPGFRIMKKHIASHRFDTVLAAGLNMSRNKIDDFFYSSKLRLNGEKVLKKSMAVNEGDQLDLIGEVESKTGKRTLKRVIIHKLTESSSKSNNNKPLAILIVWKSGLHEEDSYKKF